MRLIPVVIAMIAIVSVPAIAQHDQHAQMNHRGGQAMGFDQDKTTHHFLLYEDGGAIDIAVKDPKDVANRDAIRSHLPHIAQRFGQADFEIPAFVHDSHGIPGTKLLTDKKAAIQYSYVETANGGRLNLVTHDTEALAAIHDFLKFQIAEHKTGDSLTIKKR